MGFTFDLGEASFRAGTLTAYSDFPPAPCLADKSNPITKRGGHFLRQNVGYAVLGFKKQETYR
jgi:hypothetical protein